MKNKYKIMYTLTVMYQNDKAIKNAKSLQIVLNVNPNVTLKPLIKSR